MNTKVKLLLLALTLCMGSIIARADGVNRDKAAAMAASFWQRSVNETVASTEFRCVHTSASMTASYGSAQTTSNSVETPLWYLFSGPEGKGFVLVAGDDLSTPVLGYSFEGTLSQDLPLPMRDYLRGIEAEIKAMREQGVAKAEPVQKLWSATPRPAAADVVRLNTALWNQGYPYNMECPMDGSERSVTGCAATAACIIMKYYRWPDYGVGSTNSYYTSSQSLFVPSRNLEHKYDWDKMYDTYSYNCSESYGQPVAQLMADVGAAITMDYSASGSGAFWDLSSLSTHFKYNRGVMQIYRDNYSDAEWKAMLKEELDNRRPVPYVGYDENNQGGHQYVIDGYNTDDYFWLNWGWGGSLNGYFQIGALNPSPYKFNNTNIAYPYFYPAANQSDDDFDNWLTYYNEGLVCTQTSFAGGGIITLDHVIIANISGSDFSGVIRAAVADEEGNIREWVSDNIEFNLPNHYLTDLEETNFQLPSTLYGGDRLRFYYKSASGQDWHLVWAMGSAIGKEVVLKGVETIEEVTSLSYDRKTQLITITTKNGVTATLTRSGQSVGNALSTKDNVITINTAVLTVGTTYTVTLSKGIDAKTFTFTVKEF